MILVATTLMLSIAGARQVQRLPFSAFDISSDGKTVVGRINDPHPDPYAEWRDQPAYWTKDGGLKKLDMKGYTHGAAYRVSADGRVIVGCIRKHNETWAVVWNRDGKMQLIAPFDCQWPTVGIFPQVSGDGKWLVGTTDGKPFKWSKATGLQLLPTLYEKRPQGAACDISYDGSVIVGGCDGGPIPKLVEQVEQSKRMMGLVDMTCPYSLKGCVWTDKLMPDRIPGTKTALWEGLEAVSADGSVATGNSEGETSRSKPFVWTRSEGFRLLKEIGGERAYIWGISPDGRIIYGGCDTVWVNEKPMRVAEFLGSRNMREMKGLKPYAIRSMSRNGDVVLVDAVTPKYKGASVLVHRL
jgi:uncharacterized membrane protein